MRALIVAFICLLGACGSGLVYKPAPSAKIPSANTFQMTGQITPWGLYFTAVTRYDGTSARVVVLSEIGLKLLDFSANPNGAEVYYKTEKLPAAAAGAFVRFTQQNLLTPCPPKNLSFTDRRTRARFETTLQGDTVCL